jgi:hypothetical protein
MKKNVFVTGILALGVMASCARKGCTDPTAVNFDEKAKQEDGTCIYANENFILVNDNITSNTVWSADNIYVLGNRVTVTNGATLTIEPGTIIKGQAGTGANATCLVIARGAKLMAEGTEENPIIFTTVADEIEPGQTVSPNLDPSLNGLWGGLIVLGYAPISADAAEVQVEGIPASDPNGLYGGSVADDNSGVLRYVSIRHGGANIGEGNEINGLTLGGVGHGTTIENIEIVANQDDGVEFFGGTVNVSNLLVWNAGDDAIDTDQGFSGSVNNFIVVCGAETDHALEIDGPEGSLIAGHTLNNGSVKGFENAELADFRASAVGSFSNIFFFNFPDPAVAGRGDFSLSTGSDAMFTSGLLNFNQLETILPDGVALTSVFKNGTDVHASAVTVKTIGADKNVFTWTWASRNSELTSF